MQKHSKQIKNMLSILESKASENKNVRQAKIKKWDKQIKKGEKMQKYGKQIKHIASILESKASKNKKYKANK